MKRILQLVPVKIIILKSSYNWFKYWHYSAAPAADCQLLVYSVIFMVTSYIFPLRPFYRLQCVSNGCMGADRGVIPAICLVRPTHTHTRPGPRHPQKTRPGPQIGPPGRVWPITWWRWNIRLIPGSTVTICKFQAIDIATSSRLLHSLFVYQRTIAISPKDQRQ